MGKIYAHASKILFIILYGTPFRFDNIEEVNEGELKFKNYLAEMSK